MSKKSNCVRTNLLTFSLFQITSAQITPQLAKYGTYYQRLISVQPGVKM